MNAQVHAPASIYMCVWACVHTHENTHTHKSVRGADILTVPSSLPPLLAPHSGASVNPHRFCVMQWRHRCHSEIFPRQNHWTSICNYFCTSPPQQPSALASLWIANHANQQACSHHVASQRDQLAAVFRLPRKVHHSVTFPLWESRDGPFLPVSLQHRAHLVGTISTSFWLNIQIPGPWYFDLQISKKLLINVEMTGLLEVFWYIWWICPPWKLPAAFSMVMSRVPL